MDIIDYDGYQQNQKMYGGTAGRKMGITYEGKDYILKFPGNLKEKKMKNINLSYSNSPICEYIGSHIYQMLGFETHETILGKRNEKIVVACEDFLKDNERLYEFDKIKVTFEPHFLDSNGNETNGAGVDLYEILMTIREHPFLQDVEGIEQHFWNMFVVDALIGNTDRNNSNWGIIIKNDGKKKISPIYDNGNCLNCKWDEEKMQSVLESDNGIEAEAFKARRCIFELGGKQINPYHLIERMEYKGCAEAVFNLTPIIGKKMPEIKKMINEIPVLSETQKRFYIELIKQRYQKVLLPVHTKLLKKSVKEELKPKRRGRCI
jgi:hypothetical protein